LRVHADGVQVAPNLDLADGERKVLDPLAGVREGTLERGGGLGREVALGDGRVHGQEPELAHDLRCSPSASKHGFRRTCACSSCPRNPRSRTCSSAHLPTRSSLSSLTIQGMFASKAFDSESVSCPTRMCIFSRRRMRWGSSPNGLIPKSAPWARIASQRYSPYG